ncbi:MFS transporter, YNFM family, putative membrane transport protein [Allopseudospirillum japonicum]|uniref:MFS transporter, YNFM family, putative membrane transport protein n=1 Tax=Allopseudospirillum japonicum TaxID=64971 RepID=A0A1H6QXU9_9GAMM|nr:MFS transporter [Allopseudospirillum japonicum]SEI48439.1 MFS transporter, YNFM family, putative membrane transport protein [Allopseudospirillum japonicum]
MQASKAFNFAMLCASFLVFANLYALQPMLPVLMQTFDLSPTQASHLMNVSTFTLAVALFIYGPLSDAYGRKPLMLISMLAAIAVTLILPLATSFETLLILRALQGFFLGGLPAIAVAYLAEELAESQFLVAVGLYISGNTLGGLGGRLISGALTDYLQSWQASLWILGGFSLILWMLAYQLLPKSHAFQARPFQIKQSLQDFRQHLARKELSLVYLVGGLNFFIFINLYTYITFVLSKAPYHLSPFWLGLLFVTYLSGTYAASRSGQWAKGRSLPLMMALGISLLLVGTGLTLIPDIKALILGLLINAFGFFLSHSLASAWVSKQAQHARASASALYSVAYYLGASTGGIYLGYFWQAWGWLGVVLAAWAVLAFNLGSTLYLHQQTKRTPTTTNSWLTESKV